MHSYVDVVFFLWWRWFGVVRCLCLSVAQFHGMKDDVRCFAFSCWRVGDCRVGLYSEYGKVLLGEFCGPHVFLGGYLYTGFVGMILVRRVMM